MTTMSRWERAVRMVRSQVARGRRRGVPALILAVAAAGCGGPESNTMEKPDAEAAAKLEAAKAKLDATKAKAKKSKVDTQSRRDHRKTVAPPAE